MRMQEMKGNEEMRRNEHREVVCGARENDALAALTTLENLKLQQAQMQKNLETVKYNLREGSCACPKQCHNCGSSQI